MISSIITDFTVLIFISGPISHVATHLLCNPRRLYVLLTTLAALAVYSVALVLMEPIWRILAPESSPGRGKLCRYYSRAAPHTSRWMLYSQASTRFSTTPNQLDYSSQQWGMETSCHYHSDLSFRELLNW